MQNPDHRLAVNFTPTSLSVRQGAATWQLALHGYGYGDELRAARHTTPHAIANRVEYRREGMTEWYVNGPFGLEQGFTLPRAPGERSGDPLTLAFTLSGNLAARVDQGGKDVTLTRPDGTRALKYRGLTAHDATGRELPAWLEVEGQRLSLRVDDMNAHYPVVVDPFIEQAQLTAPDGLPGDQFGFVAMDGDVIVVGAPFDDIGPNIDQGSAYVFVKPAGGWNGVSSEPARLIASDGAGGDTFGLQVAISGDTIVVGARWDDIEGRIDQGSGYVFVKPEGGWSGTLNQTAKLTASDSAANDIFGDRVAIDGDTIVIGARAKDIETLFDRGSAYVFVKPAGGWIDNTENATLNPVDSSLSPQFGSSVAIDGHTIVVGAWRTSSERGAAYVFAEPPTGWTGSLDPHATLTASDAEVGDLFGVSVAVNADTVAVGAYRDDTAVTINHGSAYVFDMPPGGWSGTLHQNAKLTASDAATGAEFGNPLAVSGPTIVVGAALDNVGANNDQGSAYVFLRPVGGWSGALTENDKLNAAAGAAADQFGTSVAVSDNIIVVGANLDDVAARANQGSAYVFLRDDPATVTLSPSELTGPIDMTHTITAAVVSVSGQPLRDVIVRFSVSGAVTTDGHCTTDATGQCAFTYDGPSTAGTDTVVGFADANRNGVRDAGEPEASATKTWVDDNVEDDQDADGIGDSVDNCVSVANPDQTNTDGDAQGDACDPDDDNDGVTDENDAFPLDPSEWTDTDGDGTGNNADGDDDNDGVPDAMDAFPLNPLESRDTDGDGTGDNADPDDDNDGIPDSIDAFPFDPARGLLLALTPPTDTNAVGTQHCVTALVTGALDSPVPGVTVRFTVTGSIESSASIVTDAGGRAVFCYIGPTLPGADAIVAHADFDGDGVVDAPEPTAGATKSWLLPTAGAGQVTGGGQAAAAEVDSIAFGFNAKSSEGGFNGNCNVVDRTASVHIKCIDVLSLVRSGNSATIFGNATFNGADTTYRIDVQDIGEPGIGVDSFTIVTASGYSAGGVLTAGNVQVR